MLVAAVVVVVVAVLKRGQIKRLYKEDLTNFRYNYKL